MQMKTNKNGVKLLAAVMVFAMVFAGVVIVSEENDAATTIPEGTPELDQAHFTSGLAAGSYKLKENITVSSTGFNFTNDVVIYGNGKTITLQENINISASATFYDVTFIMYDRASNTSNAQEGDADADTYINFTGENKTLTLSGCVFKEDANTQFAIRWTDGKIIADDGTDFNDKKITVMTAVTDGLELRNAVDAYININTNINMDFFKGKTVDVEGSYVLVGENSSISSMSLRGTTAVDFNGSAIPITNTFIKASSAAKISNGTLTTSFQMYEGAVTPTTLTVEDVKLVGENVLGDKVTISVGADKTLEIDGELTGAGNITASAGATLINNNTVPGTNLLPVNENSSGEGWSFDKTTKVLTLNGYNGSGVFSNNNIATVVLIGDNAITLDSTDATADVKAIVSTALTSIKTLATGTGSLSITITGEKASSAIAAGANLTINGVSIDVEIDNDKTEGSTITAISFTGDLKISFSEIAISVADAKDKSMAFSSAGNLEITGSVVDITAPVNAFTATTTLKIADSDIVIETIGTSIDASGIDDAITNVSISNESSIDLTSTKDYAYKGGFVAAQGSEIAVSGIQITTNTKNYAKLTNEGNMFISEGKTFTNYATFTNNGVVGVYGIIDNAAGETINNGEINTYGYKAGDEQNDVTFAKAAGDNVTIDFTNVKALADGTFTLTVTITDANGLPISPIEIKNATMTVVNNTITIKAVSTKASVNITATFTQSPVDAVTTAMVKSFNVIVSEGKFQTTEKDQTTLTANKTNVVKLAGLVKTPEANQTIGVSGGELTNNGSIEINTIQNSLISKDGTLVNAGSIRANKDITVMSGTLKGDVIDLGVDVDVTLTGKVETSFAYAGKYTYTDIETDEKVTVEYDNLMSVAGTIDNLKFSTSTEPVDADGVASFILVNGKASTGNTTDVTITVEKGTATASDNASTTYVFGKGVIVKALSGTTITLTGDVDVEGGVLAIETGATLNIKGDDVSTYTYGTLSYVISFEKENYTYYGNLVYALANASEGMVLILNKTTPAVTIDEDLVVGKGITLQFAKGATLSIGATKKVTISMLEGASFLFTDKDNAVNIGASGAIFSGSIIYDVNTVVLDKVVMTSADKLGCEAASKTDASKITVKVATAITSGSILVQNGKASLDVDFSANAIDKTSSKLTVADGAISAGPVTLGAGAFAVIDGTLVLSENTTTISATVSGKGSIALDDAKIVVFDGIVKQNITVTNKAGTDKVVLKDFLANNEAGTDKVTITSVKATATKAAYLNLADKYYSGIIEIIGNGAISGLTVDTKAVLEVPAGSTLSVLADSAVTGLVKVAGTLNMKVAGDASTVSYATLAYDITYADGDYTVYTIVTTAIKNASAGDSFTLTKDLEVTGKQEIPSGVTIIVPEDYKITLGNNAYIIIGTGITTLGATGGIQGTVELSGNAYVVEFADASMDNSKMKIVGPTSTTKIVDSQVTALNELYATIYAIEGGIPLGSSTTGPLSNVVPKIDGFRFVKFTDVVDVDITGDVGAKDVVAKMLASQVQVTFTKVEGISYYVDNEKMNIVGAPVYVDYGSTITAVADYGYEGTPLVNGKAYITIDNTTTTITGSGVSPASAPETSSDSGMGITDYLLIVLVVLAAILVVVVAIRMMRS